MKKYIAIIFLLCIVMLTGCYREVETVTFKPVDAYKEVQCLGSFDWINIAELEGLQGVTEAMIYVPVPKEAEWDPENGCYTMPNNYDNKNGESFVMKLTLAERDNDDTLVGVVAEMEAEVGGIEGPLGKYKGKGVFSGRSTAGRYWHIEELDELVEGEETQAPLNKTIQYNIVAYKFGLENYYLVIDVEIVKRRGTVNDSSDTYINALHTVIDKLDLNN